MTLTKNSSYLPSSFRDPSGFLFLHQGEIYRQINRYYKKNYDYLIDSGLYSKLVDKKLLVSHDEIESNLQTSEVAYKIIKPNKIPFLSYPHEWCFSQLKDAALCTLGIQKLAMQHGMTLKDASAFNIQFKDGKPLLIDTLSFDKYREGCPWIAYRQFCQHFLAPLALMKYRDCRLNQLFRVFIDGIPLDLASLLLPKRTLFRFSLLSHVHLHSRAQKYFADKTVVKKGQGISPQAVLGLIDSLENTIQSLRFRSTNTQWTNYYENIHYSHAALAHKTAFVSEVLNYIKPQSVWDLGANIGFFSRLASDLGIMTVSFDSDHGAVEKNYSVAFQKNETRILPLVLDLTNPTSSFGWADEERLSFLERGPADAVFALALIHHLCISNNVPLESLARFFSKMCKYLVIEFVPKNDAQVQRLLANRVDIFSDYNRDVFEKVFNSYFRIIREAKIRDSERYIYLMARGN